MTQEDKIGLLYAAVSGIILLVLLIGTNIIFPIAVH